MSNLEHGLGGRLPLLEPEKLQSKQRDLYGKINSGVVPLAAAAGFEGRDEQGHLIGPFNAMRWSWFSGHKKGLSLDRGRH